MEATKPAVTEDLLFRQAWTVEMDVERVAFAENAMRMQFSTQKTAEEHKGMLKMYRDMRP
ncbi:hypothetical protein [Cupriavidus necator]